jgi:hypothetical protein
MAPAMQEPMLLPMPASAQPPMPPSMASMAPPSEPGSPETVAPPEPFVAPLRVQQGNGGSVVIPMPRRLRPRRRGRRFVPRPAIPRPLLPRPLLPPSGYAPGFPPPEPHLQGWSGFNGWSRY